MKKRFAENPELATELRLRAHRKYCEDPTLIMRMATARKLFYESNPDARVRAGTVARDRAARRSALRTELMAMAEKYRLRYGNVFAIPARSEEGWKEAVMVELIERLKALLSASDV
jgi:hypothetical protein